MLVDSKKIFPVGARSHPVVDRSQWRPREFPLELLDEFDPRSIDGQVNEQKMLRVVKSVNEAAQEAKERDRALEAGNDSSDTEPGLGVVKWREERGDMDPFHIYDNGSMSYDPDTGRLIQLERSHGHTTYDSEGWGKTEFFRDGEDREHYVSTIKGRKTEVVLDRGAQTAVLLDSGKETETMPLDRILNPMSSEDKSALRSAAWLVTHIGDEARKGKNGDDKEWSRDTKPGLGAVGWTDSYNVVGERITRALELTYDPHTGAILEIGTDKETSPGSANPRKTEPKMEKLGAWVDPQGREHFGQWSSNGTQMEVIVDRDRETVTILRPEK